MSNQTTVRPLSFWSRTDPIQFKQPFVDYWPAMKMRAEASASGGRRVCNVSTCSSALCGASTCPCICHYAVAGPTQPDTENLPLFMAGIQRSRTEPNLATHPAVTIRKYLLGNETGEGQSAFNACHPPSSGGANTLPWINDSMFSKCCPGSQNWFTRRPPTTIEHRDKLQTPYNERAKSGFKYWYLDRPKPTQFGRYSIGAKHTQMGLGFAPRS